jgi:hypothetical protein
MDRADIEALWRFTDYSWGAYERVIRPLGDGEESDEEAGQRR